MSTPISELRQDLVTGEWVVVATGREKRPNNFKIHSRVKRRSSKVGCPFESLLPEPLLVLDRQGGAYTGDVPEMHDWWVQVVKNKYPAFGHGICSLNREYGPYRWQDGVGFHEVVITRDHNLAIAEMTPLEAALLFRAYRQRYRELERDGCVRYISIFHNHGRDAGASILHPHSQIIAIPVIPPDIFRSLRGSAEYSHKQKKCVHCTMLEFELADGKRIILQEDGVVAFCPYVSRQAFEVRIFPLVHNPHFERSSDEELAATANALRIVLAKIQKGLGDPAYNFYIHTAPTRDAAASHHYHWHLEMVPKTAVWAGFEIGTGIEISTTSPEAAAEFLRGIVFPETKRS